jgi:hypothetical protein
LYGAGRQAPPPAVPRDAIEAILDAFRTHRFVGLGGAHGNQQWDEFTSALVRDPRFGRVVNDVLIEFGNARYQDLVDQSVGGAEVPTDLLRQCWLNTTQPQAASFEMPPIFRVARAVNATVPPERRLRLLLGDPPIDWDSIQSPEQLRAWRAAPGNDADRYAAELVRREVLMRNRRVLAIYGAGHFFRQNVTHSLVSLLEGLQAGRAFTIWTNSAVDLQNLQADVASWRVPSLALVRGTMLGRAGFIEYFPASARAGLPAAWRVPMEEQFDAVLYVGPLSAMTSVRPAPSRCSDPAHAERLRRMALSPLTQRLTERLRQNCRPDTPE